MGRNKLFDFLCAMAEAHGPLKVAKLAIGKEVFDLIAVENGIRKRFLDRHVACFEDG
jgi:hypothetical protein